MPVNELAQPSEGLKPSEGLINNNQPKQYDFTFFSIFSHTFFVLMQ
jgi:hypothetical protein